MNKTLAVLLVIFAAGCANAPQERTGGTVMDPTLGEIYVPPLDPKRKVSEQDCGGPVDIASGNLMCMGPEAAEAERRRLEEEERQRKLAAERRARMEEEARQARARMEAEERARLERERAEQLAREEAARKARAAEEERLAAERKAREERERQEREAARQRAEQEAREAAERERQRLEQEWLAGRALLERFVATYGKVEKFREVAVPISGFLDKTR